MEEPSNWWWVFEYVWLFCIYIPGCNVLLFSFWFVGMQIIAGMVAGYQVGRRTGNMHPGWGLLAGAGIGFLMAVMALIARAMAHELTPHNHPFSDYVDPTFDFAVPPLTALIVVLVTWLLCRWWQRLKAALRRASGRSHGPS